MDNVPFMNSVVGDKGASVKFKHIMIRLSLINEATLMVISIMYVISMDLGDMR